MLKNLRSMGLLVASGLVAGCGDRSPGPGRLAAGTLVVVVPGPLAALGVDSVPGEPAVDLDSGFHGPLPARIALGVRGIVADDTAPAPAAKPDDRPVLVRLLEGEHRLAV